MNPSPARPVDPQVLDALRERLSTDSGSMTLESFIECALYHPRHGYYCRQKERVGRREDADFYTASSLGSVFARLVVASMDKLAGEPLEAFTFVEAGPESAMGIMGALDESPFKDHLLLRPGDPLEIPGKAIVFSNELFDAQPFRRFVRKAGQWLEMGVALQGDRLQMVEMEPEGSLPGLPASVRDGYVIDWPGKALELLQAMCRRPWSGLFVAFDYGLDRSVAFSSRPEGTGRTYTAHQMGQDLLENPGHTDITCHVIWDDMEDILRQNQFKAVEVQRQESFLMNNGQAVIAEILQSGGGGFDKDKQTLMELLHPDNMGHKFQVLSARRA